ncbi:short-chain dehydrogenase [Colletotrichum godetiae]|uniref:Short-chain dehydrogenase n=1 Tax=Colletotrichum godetiae TaxID=1209918 RepID=A0AAJ0EPM2_9PEZI|nr:short-chain dehydrogenase [Colletotrichum godetiae]KAK1671841.1 short-chain dehydrogenase [Colletotrichum godetiae]
MSIAGKALQSTLRFRTGKSLITSASKRTIESSPLLYTAAFHNTTQLSSAQPVSSDPMKDHAFDTRPHMKHNYGRSQFADFNLKGEAFIVTGRGSRSRLEPSRGSLRSRGSLFDTDWVILLVYCLDRQEKPHEDYAEALARVVPEWGGSLQYRQADVVDTKALDEIISGIADENQGLHGLIAAAGIQQITPSTEYTADDVEKMLAVNYTGVFMSATSVARQMIRYKSRGSICMIASMSGLIANHGLLSPVYNSSKAALIQLARNLAMEWSPMTREGTGGIRVNCISPGHIMTPMVRKNFEEVPGLKEEWESLNMFGRLADTTEFKGAALFLMSNASSFMTGSNMIIDGGHTAW